jgi:hypothetical protein
MSGTTGQTFISGISPSLIAEINWAKEKTLSSLISKSDSNFGAVLKALAKDDAHFAELQKIAKRTTDATEQTTNSTGQVVDSIKETNNNLDYLGKWQREQLNAMLSWPAQLSAIGANISKAVNFDSNNAAAPYRMAASNLSNLSSTLKSLGPEFAGVSKFLGWIGLAAGGLSFLFETLQKTNEELKAVYASGVRIDGGFTELANSASAAGLSTKDFAEVLTKNANVSVSLGTRRTTELMKVFAETTRNGANLIMSNKESQLALMDYASILQTTGSLQTKTTQQLATESVGYIGHINDLSAATGRSRDAIMALAKESLKSAQVYTAMSGLPKEAQDKFRSTLTDLSATFGSKDIGEQISRLMIGGIGHMNEEYRLLFTGLGGGIGQAMQDIANISRAGGDTTAAQEELVRRVHSMSQQQLDALARSKPALAEQINAMRMNTQAQYDQLKKEENMTVDQINADRRRRQEAHDRQAEQQNALNKATKTLSQFQNTMTILAANTATVLIPVFNALSTIVGWVADGFGLLKTGFEKIIGVFGFDTQEGSGGNAAAGMAALLTTTAVAMTVRKVGMSLLTGAGASIFKRLVSFGGKNALGAGGIPGGGILGGALGSLGKGLGELGKATGTTISAVLEGLANGLKALGNPKVLLGVASMAGIAASVWIAAKAFQEFNTVDWGAMVEAGVAIVALSAVSEAAGAAAGYIAAGGAAIGFAILAIGAGIAGATWLMGKALPVLADGMQKFADLDGESLISTGKGMLAISAGLVAMTGGSIVNGLGGLVSGLLGMFQEDPITKLKRFAEIGEPLNLAANALQLFSTAMPKAIDAIASLNRVDFSGMQRLRDALAPIPEPSPGFLSAISNLVGSNTPAPQASSTTPTTPTITTETLNKSTLEYYEKTVKQFTRMIELLEQANDLNDRHLDVSDRRLRNLARVVADNSGRLS